MKALLVIDVQDGIIKSGAFNKEIAKIEVTIQAFRAKNRPVIFLQHFDQDHQSPLHRDNSGSKINKVLRPYAEIIIEKQTPSGFFKTELASVLERLEIDQLFITGFEAEFCCFFTAVAAFDRGFKVSVIEDAIGAVNTGATYQMADLDVKRFVGTVLKWSNAAEVINAQEAACRL
ncbi:Nicotinamidase-related amidase [Amphibacillus marinus]|uniref:Nicotinamidase-related amidase n=1 Tax=Amphibacillus marinus TaxID=872970 RepID=A0A1H8M8I4_9BACI|nr:isochorismatase family cysteine hydrolase [Amphibacillus marinus]SEO13614.1 Nicotinamidase-related amidase [Amphibacillus marinus]